MKQSACLIIGMIFLEACSGGGGGSSSQGVSGVIISPRPLAVQKGNNTIFITKDLSGQLIPQSSLTWSVDGTAINGSVDSNGLYAAPASIPPQNPVTLRAVLVNDPSKNDAVSFYVLTGPAISFKSPFEVTNFNQQGNPVSFHIAVFNQNTYVTWATTSATGGTTGLWYSKGDSDGNFSTPHDILGDLLSYNYTISSSTVVENPVIALDNTVDSSKDPGVYIAWDDNSNGIFQVNLVKGPNSISSGCLITIPPTPCFTPFAVNGSTNTTSIQLAPSISSDQHDPSLAISSLNHLDFALTEVYTISPGGPRNLVIFKELNPDGTAVSNVASSTPVAPNIGINSQNYPKIGVDPYGNISVAWVDNSGLNPPNIFYSRLNTGTMAFDPAVQIETDSLKTSDTFSMTIDSNGQPHLAWSETSLNNATTGIFYSTYDDPTLANFISPVKLTTNGSNGYNPTIKVDLLNYLYLSWDDSGSTFFTKIFTKTGAPPAPGSLANLQWQILGVNPVMNIDDGGRVYLLYSTTGGSNPSTYYVKGD